MVKRIGGTRRKTRNKFSKNIRKKGKISLRKYFQEFKKGEKVLLNIEPGIQKGIYSHRFHSKIGVIKEKKGNCYTVAIKDKSKQKTLVIHPVHLRKA
ncbi:50S ribosomal protein L21e [Candidatus Woesearchaeota archaeon]|jgi:large subunit ribosomal protein L21e|nr:50S ribosomal protein L21e [Candidatus Woesearchaeota archaeon]|tara:strand:- start:16636 stop:16926 length:291 start_codon:yes stop_codon:yes gene_type:complete